jgi:hypothetical protein
MRGSPARSIGFGHPHGWNLGDRNGVERPMKRELLAAVLAVVLAACATPGASPSPSAGAGAGAVEGLVTALTTAGVSVRQADRFDAAPLPGQGVLLCVGREEVRVYVFETEEARVAAARTIDPNDPSHVGTSIVEWVGNPRFWQRDRILVLYVGTDAPTEALLTTVMGAPFARGVGGGLGGPRVSSC